MEQGLLLVFFVREKDRLHGKPAFEWLLSQAKTLGIGGGSAFRAVAGFGRHGRLHEDHFFELSGDMAIQVELLATPAQAERMVQAVRDAQGSFAYMEAPCRYGMTIEAANPHCDADPGN